MAAMRPSVPAKSVRELVDLARKRPGELYFASAGTNSATHLAGELFGYMAKVKLTHVPYKGGAPGVTYLIRPDQHVAARFARYDPDAVRRALARAIRKEAS